jgi:hypothetical protein
VFHIGITAARVGLPDFDESAADRGSGLVEDAATCSTVNLGLNLHFSASERAGIDMGKIRFDGGNAQQCIDALAARDCDLTSESNRVVPEACFQIIGGTLHPGETCTLDAECISQMCQVQLDDSTIACPLGTCFDYLDDTAPVRAKLGESCSRVNCDDASRCDDATETCVAMQSRGAPCKLPTECAFGLGCDSSGVCASLPSLGESCTGACRDDGNTCSPTSQTCVKVVLAGGACASNVDCSPIYRCDATNHCSSIALGQPCESDQLCADDRAFCDSRSGTCMLPKADGMLCVHDSDCDSQHCDRLATCSPDQVCL